ncbi:MAG: SHOCT domain-containing protein, partial [Clostridia bacterium]|nr:SHOCT domain-containing protein [Clostridia bacterium]
GNNDNKGIWAGRNSQAFSRAQFKDADRIKDYVEKANQSRNPAGQIVTQQLSPADELKKFKELLDMGIITQEEFDAKKKQLLGL